jgi:quinol monooxygenase YgiN
MFTLQIEHRVCDFDAWKKAFDNYTPFQSEDCVHRYRIFRSLDNPNYVMIDLDFERSSEANKFVEAMQQLWERVEGKLIDRPQVRIVEALENQASRVKQAV